MSTATHRIVIVDDNPADIVLLRHALAASGLHFEPTVLGDGQAALQFVKELGNGAATGELPALVILDLNMPCHDGIDVLRAIRALPRLTGMAVAILTSSDSAIERAEAQKIGVTAYLRKPINLDGYLELGRMFSRLCNGRDTSTPTHRV